MSTRSLRWPRRAVSTFAICCFCALSVAPGNAAPIAKTTVAQPALFRTATLFDARQISLRVLPNGVRSIVKTTRGSNVVAIQVWVRAGSRHEGERQNGAAHLLGVAAVNASRAYSLKNGGIKDFFSGLGSEIVEQTARDSTNFSATVAPQFASEALRALADATLHPDLSNAALSLAKVEALEDIAVRNSDPVSATSDLAYATAFARHNYRRSALGDETDIQVLTSTRLRDFHRSRYSGANISVVIVGEIDAMRAHQLTAQFFAETPRSTPEKTSDNSSFTAKNVRRFSSAARSTTSLSFRAPGLNSSGLSANSPQTPEDVVATDVLLSYWNEGRDAQMRKVLLRSAPTATTSTRGESGDESGDENSAENITPPALGLDIAFLTQRDSSLLTFTFVTDPENTARAEKTLFDEIARVRKNGLNATEMQRAKNLLSRQYIAQGETPSGQAGALGFYDVIGGYDFAVNYLDRIARVSNRDISRVVARYFQPSRVVRIVVEPTLPGFSLPDPSSPNAPDNPLTDAPDGELKT